MSFVVYGSAHSVKNRFGYRIVSFEAWQGDIILFNFIRLFTNKVFLMFKSYNMNMLKICYTQILISLKTILLNMLQINIRQKQTEDKH